jgi:hypothetical protein
MTRIWIAIVERKEALCDEERIVYQTIVQRVPNDLPKVLWDV